MKGFALGFALKQRRKATQKLLIWKATFLLQKVSPIQNTIEAGV